METRRMEPKIVAWNWPSWTMLKNKTLVLEQVLSVEYEICRAAEPRKHHLNRLPSTWAASELSVSTVSRLWANFIPDSRRCNGVERMLIFQYPTNPFYNEVIASKHCLDGLVGSRGTDGLFTGISVGIHASSAQIVCIIEENS